MEQGDRIELIHTDDPYTHLKPGDKGTVDNVTRVFDITQIGVAWDDGSSLTMIPESGDQIKVLKPDPEKGYAQYYNLIR